jgi:hypothetical protein
MRSTATFPPVPVTAMPLMFSGGILSRIDDSLSLRMLKGLP